MSSARKPPIIGGIRELRATRIARGLACREQESLVAFTQKPPECEADEIMPPISDGWFLTITSLNFLTWSNSPINLLYYNEFYNEFLKMFVFNKRFK